MQPQWHRALDDPQRRAWDEVLRPVAGALLAQAHEISVEVTRRIGDQLPELLRGDESFEANRASTEASILGFAHILEQGVDPATTNLGAATLAYAQEGARHSVELTTLIRSYRLGHAAAWEQIAHLIAEQATSPGQRALAIELCSAWLFAYVDAALCLAEDFYSAERELWVRSAAATRAETVETILAGAPIETSAACRRLGYELDRHHTAVVVWLHAHQEGHDPQPALEAAVRQIHDQLAGQSVLVHSLGTLSVAAWISTFEPVTSRRLEDLRLDMHRSPGVRVGLGDPAPGMAGFRQSHEEATFARRVAELAARPLGTITRYSNVALTAIATADLDQARAFVRRELRDLVADDDATTRLTATLRTYLDEQSSRSRTARRLGIHENTVTYRLKQAEEILGRSVDQRTLELRVALALAHVVRHAE